MHHQLRAPPAQRLQSPEPTTHSTPPLATNAPPTNHKIHHQPPTTNHYTNDSPYQLHNQTTRPTNYDAPTNSLDDSPAQRLITNHSHQLHQCHQRRLTSKSTKTTTHQLLLRLTNHDDRPTQRRATNDYDYESTNQPTTTTTYDQPQPIQRQSTSPPTTSSSSTTTRSPNHQRTNAPPTHQDHELPDTTN